MMFKAIETPYLVPFDGNVKLRDFKTSPISNSASKQMLKDRLKKLNESLQKKQRVLFGHHKYSILLVFQGMDASGKDGAIREVLSGVDPAGCQVFSFGPPSQEDVDHDFLWRTTKCLPGRGKIGVFNRSYYEEVIIVRVHPKLLIPQNLPNGIDSENIWNERLQSIRDHEKHLARNGVIILKFWLNISKSEQKKRLMTRIEDPSKVWKLDESDVLERDHWNEYLQAYETALAGTSTPWAPWYAIPADDKAFARVCIAETILKSLDSLDLSYSKPSSFDEAKLKKLKKLLEEH